MQYQNTTKICDYQISERFVKADHPNTAWGKKNPAMTAAFVAAFTGCPRCGSSNIGSSSNGAYVCYDCGKVWL